MTCPVCGLATIVEAETERRRCPNCFHPLPEHRSASAEPPAGTPRLSDLSPGDEAEIARVHAADPAALRKIIAMGLLPQVRVRLLRKFPSFVFEAGESHFTVDRELASAIYVVPKRPA